MVNTLISMRDVILQLNYSMQISLFCLWEIYREYSILLILYSVYIDTFTKLKRFTGYTMIHVQNIITS